MSANQLISMIVRLVMRKAIGKGIDAGFKAAGQAARRRGDPQQASAPGKDRALQKQARKARQAMKAAQRIGKLR